MILLKVFFISDNNEPRFETRVSFARMPKAWFKF